MINIRSIQSSDKSAGGVITTRERERKTGTASSQRRKPGWSPRGWKDVQWPPQRWAAVRLKPITIKAKRYHFTTAKIIAQQRQGVVRVCGNPPPGGWEWERTPETRWAAPSEGEPVPAPGPSSSSTSHGPWLQKQRDGWASFVKEEKFGNKLDIYQWDTWRYINTMKHQRSIKINTAAP